MQAVCLASSDESQIVDFVRNQFSSIKAGTVYCELFGNGSIVLASVRQDQAQIADVNPVQRTRQHGRILRTSPQ